MALAAHDAFSAGGGGRRNRRRARRGALSEINVTPLVDVMLVLLIIFMISAPLLTVGVPVELPKTEAGAMDEQTEPLTISIRADGRVFIQESETPFDQLAPRLKAMAGEGFDKPIYVRADGRATYTVVAQVMASLSTSGFSSINLITDTGGPSSGVDKACPDAMRARERTSLNPALAGSALLHFMLFAATLISWPWLTHPTKPGSVVPIKIVANAPTTDLRAALEADAPEPALTETPAPDAPAVTTAPTPEPKPAPPAPQPTPTPKPAPPQPTPAPKPAAAKPATTPAAKPQPAQKPAAKPSLDLDALQASLKPRAAKPSGDRRSSAQQGPARPETAAIARPALGAADAAAAFSALSEELGRRWNPNCEVEGGADVRLAARFTISTSGRLVGAPQIVRGLTADPVTQAAAVRAVSAIRQAEPFENVPREFYGQSIVVNFNARQVCQG